MRTNLPVTNREYVLSDDQTIVSKTDLQGNITYINDDFVRVSGFTEEELLGAPQNIVRHPDMPVEAFADFWRTIKEGKAWTGLVKNRCKNGDHYWVEATAAPLVQNGQVVGYTSIRVKPDRAKVSAAEAAYRAIKSGDTSLRIVEGSAVRRTTAGPLGKLTHLSLQSRLISFSAAMVILFLALLSLALFGSPGTSSVVTIAVLGLVLALAFGLIMGAALTSRLHELEQQIAVMSGGDLSRHIVASGHDEITRVTQALRVLQTNVKLLIGQIKQSTGHVSSGAAVIAEGNAELSGRTESQASSLEETASSMEELTSTVKQNAENSIEASQLVEATAKVAEKGGEAVANVVTTMGAIKSSSGKIADIIGVIDGIAFQTNILALNAAVEAARAGEQGRGFAVVASEVRNLAQRSANAAKEIKVLINDSVAQVETGAKLVDEAGKTMGEIVTGVKRAADIMHEITTASQEQSSGIEQINQAITQMDDVTQQNAGQVEEAAASAESLRQQARALTDLVNAFRLVRTAGPTVASTARVTPIKAAHATQKKLLAK
ncbi:PAS domain-containing methyl-accepting chemotaxis protein [Undibacterium rugosum]|uniref:methyl-accepting chemotaxis protein n=1 Tax=Undibacterium rugosum TaxID=2762291 RepID=UPI001B8205B1|nr:PAS domain-containing methyl-accepting chemotaxis protein [Undibacterium rugosum]MBR7777167.1 PAS domain-containing protein [Undibacterium rugosum]